MNSTQCAAELSFRKYQGGAAARHRVRRSPRRTLALRRPRPARPRRPSLGGPADLTGSLVAHIATPRGRLHGLPMAQRMLGQVQLSAAREFGGAAAGGRPVPRSDGDHLARDGAQPSSSALACLACGLCRKNR
jgi:hypothetical protein